MSRSLLTRTRFRSPEVSANVTLMAWPDRRNDIDDLLPELQHILHLSLCSTDNVVHTALHFGRAHARDYANGASSNSVQASDYKLNSIFTRLKSNMITVDDFDMLATISSNGPFARVQLVKPGPSFGGTQGAKSDSKLYVMKTLQRKWAYRMRAVRPEPRVANEFHI